MVSIVRHLFRHLEVDDGSADLDVAIRATGPKQAALLENGLEQMRSDQPGGFKDSIHRTILKHLNPGIEWFALLHAGAVTRNGAGIVFPAESGCGKTTLVAYLMAHGYDYFADDLVAIAAPNGLILPWPLPLSVKSGSINQLQRFHDFSSSYSFPTKGTQAWLLLPPPGGFDQAPVPMRYLVFPRFDPGAKTTIRELRPLEALQRLLSGRAWLGYPVRRRRVKMFLGWLTKTRSFALTFRNVEHAAQQLECLQSSVGSRQLIGS